jgi:hypothetical protein
VIGVIPSRRTTPVVVAAMTRRKLKDRGLFVRHE